RVLQASPAVHPTSLPMSVSLAPVPWSGPHLSVEEKSHLLDELQLRFGHVRGQSPDMAGRASRVLGLCRKGALAGGCGSGSSVPVPGSGFVMLQLTSSCAPRIRAFA